MSDMLRMQAVLELLRADLNDIGDGVPLQAIAAAGDTRWPLNLIGRLRREGWVIEEKSDLFRLYEEPGSTRAPGVDHPSGLPLASGALVDPGPDDALFPDEMTLAEARDVLDGLMELGHECPTCKQHAAVYRRNLHSGIARALILLYREAGTSWVHKPTVLKGVGSAARDESIARYWGLIEEERRDRMREGRAGYWRVTERGGKFVLGELRVPRHAVIYNNRCLRLEGKDVSIFDCLGNRFSYSDLMRPAAVAA